MARSLIQVPPVAHFYLPLERSLGHKVSMPQERPSNTISTTPEFAAVVEWRKL